MPEPSLFPIGDRKFETASAFRSFLGASHAHQGAHRPLTIVVGLTSRGREDLIAALESFGLAVRARAGEVYVLASSRPRIHLESYLTYEDGGVLVFYTSYRKTEDIPLIRDFLKRDPFTHPFRFRSGVLYQSLSLLMERFESLRVTEFTARADANSLLHGRVRPGKERTIYYWGVDGKEVLQELGPEYGVLPTRVVVDVPRGPRLGIDTRGVFTQIRGSPQPLFETFEFALGEVKRTRLAFERSKFEVHNVQRGSTTFSIPQSTLATVRFKTKLDFTRADAFLNGTLREQNYACMSAALEEGSLFMSADLVSPRGYRFRLRADENEMRLFPGGEQDLRAFLDFYDLVLTHIDSDAEIVA